jgi:diaminopimelate decarboxylase
MMSQPSIETLRRIAERYGTPTYAYDVRGLRAQADKLRAALPAEIEILYSLKANASLGICDVFADYGLGADVASAGELATAVEAGFSADRIFMAGPYKSPEAIEQLRSLPETIVSLDSPDELESFAAAGLHNRVVLRLRPDFGSHAVVSAGSESRFGVLFDDLPRCRAAVKARRIPIVGFHVFAGSQVLDVDKLIQHLRGAMDISLRAADSLGIEPEFLNLGGGFGIPYGPGQKELDLTPIGEELARLVERAATARVVLELGRYLVAQAGWYLTTVVGQQHYRSSNAVVVDGGTHQRADLCGLCLRSKAYPPLVVKGASSRTQPTDVLGCLSLPADILIEGAALPPLSTGDVLAFPNAGAYGWWSSPALFHAYPVPAEVAFDGDTIHLMRPRKPAASVLDDQSHVVRQVDPVEAIATNVP